MAQFDFQPIEEAPPIKPAPKLDFEPITPAATEPSGKTGQFDFQPLATPAVTKKPEDTPTPYVDDSAIDEIAKKHNVDPDLLRSAAPFYGVQTKPNSLSEALASGAKYTAGTAGRMALNIPQWIYKKTQDEPTRNALDELRDLGESKKGYLETATEMAGFPAGIAGKGAGAAGRVAEAAGIGGTIGLTESKEGQELSGAGRGAAAGAALGGTLELASAAAGKLLSKFAKLTPAESEIVRARMPDIDKGAAEIADKTATSEQVIREIGFGDKSAITSTETDAILREQMSPESVEAYLSPSTTEGHSIRERIDGPVTDNSIKHQLVEDVLEDRLRGFTEALTGKKPSSMEDAVDALHNFTKRQGEEAVMNKYDNFVQLKQAERYIDENGLIAKDQPGWVGQQLNKVSDSQYVLRHFDDKYGIASEDALRELNKASNRYSFARQQTRRDLQEALETAQKNGADAEIQNGTKIYEALDTGDRSALSPGEQQVADRFQQYFRDGRDFVNGLVKERDPNIAPLNIPKLENYVPKIAKSVDEIVPIIEQKMKETLSTLSGRFDRDITSLAQLTAPEYKEAVKSGVLEELTQFARWADANKAIPPTGAELNRVLGEQLYTREGNVGIQSRARSAMEREGEIPDIILEKNLYKLADKWSLNTYKHLYLRNALDKLANQGSKLEKLGAAPEAEYIKRIGQDTLGVRKGTAAEGVMSTRVQAARKLDELIQNADNPVRKSALILARNMPDILYGSLRQIYPNVLGWNVHSALMHGAVSMGRIAPELGGAYGYQAMMKGAINAMGNFHKFHELAQKLGNVPSSFTRDGEQALAQGIARSGLFQKIAGANQKMGQIGMKAFQAGEAWNRTLILGTADVMARDLARGSTAAQASLARFPRNIQMAVEKVGRENQGEVFNILGKYLNDATMFNYNKQSMFEFGRSLGPVLSTFSKWPTAISGEAIYELRSKGLMQGMARNLERLAVPYLMLQAAQHAIFGAPADMSDREKLAVGARGLPGLAPLGALHEFAAGKLFTPPAVDVIYNGIIKPGLEGDISKAGFGLDTALKDYTPQAGLLRALTQDLVTYGTGHKPEGHTFIEKTQNGLKQIAK